MKVAIVHDWLISYAGAERVLENLIILYPDADIFVIVDFLPADQREWICNREINTSFIQRMPFARQMYRKYLPLMPLAVEQIDLSTYDMIISSSHAVAKGVITGPDQLHISYVHSPIRYAWDLQHQYLKEANFNSIKGLVARYLLHKIRLWDSRTANGVDFFVANSEFIARRIWKVYRRESNVIYPPVDVEKFRLCEHKEDYYITASRMVSYKKIDLIIEAFANMPDKRLIVIGDGPEYKKLRCLAGKNVVLLGYQPFEVLHSYIQNAKAFIFAAEEDFGIAPVEAQACGTPVIAYGKGGARETIYDLGHSDKPTGIFFKEQKTKDIQSAINIFEEYESEITPRNCRENSLRFASHRFKEEFKKYASEKLQLFINNK